MPTPTEIPWTSRSPRDRCTRAAHATSLLLGVEADFVRGDRAYDGGSIRDAIAAMGAETVIPPHPCRKSPAPFDAHLYKGRHAIENLLAKLKQYRSLATRYDKTMRNFSAGRNDICIDRVHSADGGRTWASLASGVPLGPVNLIREDSRDPKVLYLGTDHGVLVTTDGGATWQTSGNLSSTYVHDLAVHPRDRVLVAATHGRGMWVLDLERLNKTK